MPAPKTSTFRKILARRFTRTLANGHVAAPEHTPRPLLARRGSQPNVQHGVKLLCITVIATFIAACTPAEPTPSQSAQSTAVESPDTNEISATDATEPRAAESATAEPPEAQYDSEALSPPVLPEAAKEYSEEGAIAFTEYALAVITYTLQSGNTSPLQNVSTPDCRYCNRHIEITSHYHTDGSDVAGYEISGTEFNFVGVDEVDEDIVAISFKISEGPYSVTRDGATENYERNLGTAGIYLQWKDRWMIKFLGSAEG